MMSWLALSGAIATEAAATLCLRMSAVSPRQVRLWSLGAVVGYVLAFSLLQVALRYGMGLGMAYGIWTAVGVAVTAVLSRVLFKESFTALKALGVVLIIGGVLLVEFGARL